MTDRSLPSPSSGRCFICGESLEDVTVREITVLGELRADACGPCVDLPDTAEFVRELLLERLAPR